MLEERSFATYFCALTVKNRSTFSMSKVNHNTQNTILNIFCSPCRVDNKQFNARVDDNRKQNKLFYLGTKILLFVKFRRSYGCVILMNFA